MSKFNVVKFNNVDFGLTLKKIYSYVMMLEMLNLHIKVEKTIVFQRRNNVIL